MNKNYFYIFLLISCCFCKDLNTNLIVFRNNKIETNGQVTTLGSTVVIENPGIYLVVGETDEGSISIQSSSVTLYLQNLKLTSKETSPITIGGGLTDVRIINSEDTILYDDEDFLQTEACSVIKIKSKSMVYFLNKGTLTLDGNCKNAIKSGYKSSIIFEKSEGKYIINAYKNAIFSEYLLEFHGGEFSVFSEMGDAIKSIPDESDEESLGKIIIKDGKFKVDSFGDAFTAKNSIIISKGKFNILTQNGFDAKGYDENVSSKGFKITGNQKGNEIKIYSGDFTINSADDAFHSKRDIKILGGKFKISSRDDGFSAKYDLIIGKKNTISDDDLQIEILHSFEAIEGMTVTIYSGKIKASAANDGINASGLKPQTPERNSSWNRNNTYNRNYTRRNNSGYNWGDWGGDWGNFNWSDFNRNRNNSRNNSNYWDWFNRNGTRRNYTFDWSMFGNSSYTISIFGGDISIYTEADGIDSNGNIYIHGGNINIFSEGIGHNEPLDHDGNFTLFNAEIFGVGSFIFGENPCRIKKGNLLYAYHSAVISKDKRIQVFNEKYELLKERRITNDIRFIFYTSPKLNKNYHFHLIDELTGNYTELDMIYEESKEGIDDEDLKHLEDEYEEEENEKENENNEEKENKNEKDETTKDNGQTKTEEEKSHSNILKNSFLYILLILISLY